MRYLRTNSPAWVITERNAFSAGRYRARESAIFTASLAFTQPSLARNAGFAGKAGRGTSRPFAAAARRAGGAAR